MTDSNAALLHQQKQKTQTGTQVKICGLKTQGDIDICLEAGADYIGLVFFPKSPRHLEIEQAQKLAQSARSKTSIVALLVNPDDRLVQTITNKIQPDYIQLHGTETPSRVTEIKNQAQCKIIKALAIATKQDFAPLPHYEDVADMILLDAKPIEKSSALQADILPGGNGISFDWELVQNQTLRRPYMLAGGLSPYNVAQAVSLTNAPIVDVSSGVEAKPGFKDHQKIKQFISSAKQSEN